MAHSDKCVCEKKTDRRCNNCGNPLTEDAPNWFQCSESCRHQRFLTCHPEYEWNGRSYVLKQED